MLLGSAILLVETLENDEENITNQVLADVNIYKLSPFVALKILKTRMDISTK